MLQPRVARPRRLALIGLAGALAVSLSACAESQRDSSGGGDGGTLVFGATGAPANFDPFYASDGETFRVTRQIVENLVGIKPGTAELEPELAKSWESSEDGKTWTFELQEGVKFHDGTPFDAEAVCANFERMYNQKGAGASPALSYYWVENFGGFADDGKPSLYDGCEVKDEYTVELKLTRYTADFPTMLSQDSFAMQSPTAMEKYKANDVKAEGDSFVFSEYAQKHPTGTGPFKFSNYDSANGTIELVRNDDYWGEPAKLDKLIFQVIPNETARKQALEAGDIDGYDFPSPSDWTRWRRPGSSRDQEPFNILYLGITQGNPALRDLKVRQALAHAIDRENLVSAIMPKNSEDRQAVLPRHRGQLRRRRQEYPYDPDKARGTAGRGRTRDLTVELWYPTQVSRPYARRRHLRRHQGDLEAVRITVKPVSKPWNGDYTDDIESARAELFLLGWTGDYNSPNNFIGTFFGTTDNQFYTGGSSWGEELAEALDDADTIVDDAERKPPTGTSTAS